MSTHRRTWQRAEARAAEMFGAKRAVLSGSSNRDDRSRSDSTHPALFIESKFREKSAVRSLLDATRQLAKREGKHPLLALFDKGKPGFAVVIHSDDFADVARAYLAPRSYDPGGPDHPGADSPQLLSFDGDPADPAGAGC